MSESAGSPDLRESLKYPDTEVGAAMQVIHDGLDRHESFVDAMIENNSRRIRRGKPGERLLEPLPFEVDGVRHLFSAEPRPRRGFVVDDTISLVRGNDSLLLQVSHSESDPALVRDEAVLKFAGQTLRGEKALAGLHEAFPRFYSASVAKVA